MWVCPMYAVVASKKIKERKLLSALGPGRCQADKDYSVII